jgi:uncharacterized protein
MGEQVGAVARLSLFPVKSMQGEQVEAVEIGVVGDRAYALVDTGTGKVLSGKTPRIGTLLLGCQAAFVGAPAGDATPPVRITLPDGTSLRSDDANAHATLSALFGLEVCLRRALPMTSRSTSTIPTSAISPPMGSAAPSPNRSWALPCSLR